jgi:hypothetical protein
MFDETGNLANYSGKLRPLSGRYVTFITFFPLDALLSYYSLPDSHDSN